MIIGILIFIVFSFYFVKAIIETIWGVCLIIQSLFWHTVAYFLYFLAFLIGTSKKAIRLFRKPKPTPAKFNAARAITQYFSDMK